MNRWDGKNGNVVLCCKRRLVIGDGKENALGATAICAYVGGTSTS